MRALWGLKMNDVMIIGICGGSGSGKTTLCEELVSRYERETVYLRHDDYYKSTDGLSDAEREKINYDHPSAFDTDLMISHLRTLKNGGEVDIPVYDYTVHNRSASVHHEKSRPVIIVDGILIFENVTLRELFDVKIYVDTDADVRLARRIKRDTESRGRSLDSVIEQYLSTVKPMHDRFVEPSKKYADMIVREGGHNVVSVNMLENMIKSHIEKTVLA